jgi:hypothetical protein
MPNGDKIKALYNAVSNDYNVGTLDEFTQKLQDPNKRQALYNTVGKEYDLGDYNSFNQKLGFDSQEVQQQAQQQNQIPMANSQDLQKTLQGYTATHPISKNASLGYDVGIAPKGANGSQLITNQENANEEQLNKAAANTFNKTIGQGAYTQADSTKFTNQLKQGVKNGDLAIKKDAQGNDVIKNAGNFFQSFKAAADQAHAQDIENKYLQSVPKNEAISYLNRIAQHPQTGIVKESDIAPSGLGEAIGQQSQILGKATIGSLAGAETGLTGGASAGSFAAIANDLATSGFSGALKKTYYELKKEGLSDSDAYDKATHAALTGEAVSLGQGALLSGEIPLTPKAAEGGLLNGIKPNIEAQQGFINSLKHTATSAPKVVGSAMAGSVINDIQENAIANGNPIDAKQMFKNSIDAGESMATIHGALGLLTAVANGQKTIAPSYVRPQAENVASSLPRADVAEYLNTKEQNGDLPQGTTQKVLNTLSAFDKQKAIVAPFAISEENKAAIAGKLVQKQKLLDELQTLKPNENAFPERIAEINKNITGIDGEINKLYNAKNVFEKETDTNTGESNYQPKTFEELKPQEKNGIEVPKEYGDTEVKQSDEGDNKTFTPKAYYTEQQGSLTIKKNIPIEGTFTEKDKAQQAADNALKQHYYENGLHDNAKPDKKIETETQTEKPIQEGNVGGNANNEPITTEETQPKPTNVAETAQEPTAEKTAPIEEQQTTKINDLQEQKYSKMKDDIKDETKLNLIPAKELVKAKEPIEAKKTHDDIKDRYKTLKKLIDCI